MDAENDILEYLNNNKAWFSIVEKTKNFLQGFYSAFSLELLSTINYIAQKYNTSNIIKITDKLTNWSNRKNSFYKSKIYRNCAQTNSTNK